MFNKTAKPRNSQLAEQNSAHEAAVERLIELASDPAPPSKTPEALAVRDAAAVGNTRAANDQQPASLWKTLAQFKGALPYVSRLLPLIDARFLPLLDMLGAGHSQNTALAKELNESLASLQASQHEVQLAVRDHTLGLSQLEDQVAQLREAQEKTALDQADLLHEVRSMGVLIRAVGAGLAVLLVILIVVVGSLLTRVPH
jgi:hypothetical protein